uniref:Putative apolipoprotein n-acyltransferase n=1 Tax=Paulinella longichromatophora TaxID=1708747 RepID=A0A2H4ZP14_9EUKA|nr:putative apolipoprotein n-acyltransferase [Paulinella longichromatophora]
MYKKSPITLLIVLNCGILFGWNLVPSTSLWISWLSIAMLWEGLTFHPRIRPQSITIKGVLASSLWGLITILVSHRWLLWLHPLGWIGVPNFLSRITSLVIWLGSAICGALLVGSWAILAIWLDPRRPLSAFILAGLWGIGEVLLAKGPLFWIGVGASVVPSDRTLASFAALGGMGILATIQLLIGWTLWKIIVKSGYSEKNSSFSLLSWLTILAFLHLLSYSQMKLIEYRTTNQTLSTSSNKYERVLLWQPSIPTREKFQSREQIKLLSRLKAVEAYSKALSIPLILAPEGTLDLDNFPDKMPTIELLTGGLHRSQNHIYSGVLDFSPTQDKTVAWINKRRLVPLGEWIPFKNSWQWSGLSALGGIDQGEPSRILNREEEPIGVAICYEITDGTAMAAATNNGANWVLVLANLDPYKGLVQKQLEALSQLRSIETGRWVVTLGNTGPSSIINPKGIGENILPAFLPVIGIMELEKMNHFTPYDIFGEWFLVIMIFGAGLILATSKSTKLLPINTSPE